MEDPPDVCEHLQGQDTLQLLFSNISILYKK